MMSFAQLNLNPSISKALNACGYDQPTPIQAQAIPDVISGKDIVASAQTGTGKTAAFVLPALHRLSLGKSQGNYPRILILTPTRELARQITQAAHKYGKFLRFNIISLVGGMPYGPQIKDLSRRADIIVATPGRLLDHMQSNRINLSQIEMLILDEADRMLDMGFIDDVSEIAEATPDERQTLLFSATVDKRLTNVIANLLKNPVKINLSTQKIIPKQIIQELYMVDNLQHKTHLLNHFLKHSQIFKAVIFTATKISADRLAKELVNQGYAAAPLHGDLRQNVRNKTIEKLRLGKIQLLVATDVAARGIDIQDMTHVFNYDLPRFAEDYVHRIGRTGRAGKTGVAISFAAASDTRHIRNINRYMGQDLPKKVIVGLEPTKQHDKNDSSDSRRKKRKKRYNDSGKKAFKEPQKSAKEPKKSFKEKSFKEKSFKDKEPQKSFKHSESFKKKKSFKAKKSKHKNFE